MEKGLFYLGVKCTSLAVEYPITVPRQSESRIPPWFRSSLISSSSPDSLQHKWMTFCISPNIWGSFRVLLSLESNLYDTYGILLYERLLVRRQKCCTSSVEAKERTRIYGDESALKIIFELYYLCFILAIENPSGYFPMLLLYISSLSHTLWWLSSQRGKQK
jgi:hypothetical protein